jgi:predicted metalloenzyme YecM
MEQRYRPARHARHHVPRDLRTPMLPDHRPFLDALLPAWWMDVPAAQRWPIDHICLRVADEAGYLTWRTKLRSLGELLAETNIGGLPIATFRLHAPLPYGGEAIPLVELPAPKPGSPYPEGWEHAEVVAPVPLNELLCAHPHLPWVTSELNKPLNPALRLRYGAHSIKVHTMPLDKVILMERSAPVN